MIALFGTLMRIVMSFYIGYGFPVFLFFTIQSNIMVCIFLTASLVNSKKQPTIHPAIHGAITLYILITGIIYNTLLAPGIEAEGLNLVILTINHTVTPILFFIDRLLNGQRGRLEWKNLALWLIYPIIYLAASSIEGGVTGEFRYPFLNFINQTPVFYFIQLAVVISAFVLIGSLIILLDKKLLNRQHI